MVDTHYFFFFVFSNKPIATAMAIPIPIQEPTLNTLATLKLFVLLYDLRLIMFH
jgi:hypothetical protein